MKARIKQNIYGNWYGYLGNKRVMEFGETSEFTQEQNAQRWLAAEHGRKGGLVSSNAKATASRENGKLGGRPAIQDALTGLPLSRQAKYQRRKRSA
jgi:hypothetical protein